MKTTGPVIFRALIEQWVCGGVDMGRSYGTVRAVVLADFNGDDLVGVEDLLLLLQAFAVPSRMTACTKSCLGIDGLTRYL